MLTRELEETYAMTNEALEIEQCIDELLLDERYRELTELTPEFDLFEFIGSLSENASSKALAFLLDSSEEHGLGTKFFDGFIDSVFREGRNKELRISLRQSLQLSGEATSAVTEWVTSEGRYLDLLIKVYDKDRHLKAVVGIENKHWAIEQVEQVAHYQRELVRRFPKTSKTLLFLAPGARPSLTADLKCECQHVPCSYRSVTNALASVEPFASDEIRFLISSLRNHLDKNLEGSHAMSAKIRELVHALYRIPKHQHAIKQIMENIPRLGAITDDIQALVETHITKNFAEGSFEFSLYPKRQLDRLREMKLLISDLNNITEKESGFQLIYVLHSDRNRDAPDTPDLGDYVTVQLMIWCHNKKYRDGVEKFVADLKLPPSEGKPNSWYSQWIPLWAGKSHELTDLANGDATACANLFIEALDATYNSLMSAVEQQYPLPKG